MPIRSELGYSKTYRTKRTQTTFSLENDRNGMRVMPLVESEADQ